MNNISITITANADSANLAIKDLIKNFDNLAFKFAAVNATLTTLFDNLTKKITQFTDIFSDASRKINIEKNFELQLTKFNLDVDTALNKLRKSVNYALSDLELMSRANQALFSNISFDDLVLTLNYLYQYSQMTNKSFAQLSETVITGLVRGSTLMLDDAGIIIDQTELVDAKQQQLNRTLTEQEKKIVVVSAAFEQMREKLNNISTSSDIATITINKMTSGFHNIVDYLKGFALKIFAAANVSITAYRLLFNQMKIIILNLINFIDEKFVKQFVNIFSNMMLNVLLKFRSFFNSLYKMFNLDIFKNIINNLDNAAVNVFDKKFSNSYTFDIDERKEKIKELYEYEKNMLETARKWYNVMVGEKESNIKELTDLNFDQNIFNKTKNKETKEKKVVEKNHDIKLQENTNAFFRKKEFEDIADYNKYINNLIDKDLNELQDKFKEIEDFKQSLNDKKTLFTFELMENSELNREIYKIRTFYDNKINELSKYKDNFADIVEEITKNYEQLKQEEIKYIQDTTLTDDMKQKIEMVASAFNALHSVFTTVGDALGKALAESFEKGFNFKEFISNIAKLLRLLSIQKTVTLLFEAAYQKIMAAIYQTLAISNAIVNPPLAAAYQKAAIGATVAAAGALAGAAVMGTLATGLIVGMAHDGIANVPVEGTWLLQKNERVVDAKTNRDLTSFLNEYNKYNKDQTVNVTINFSNSDYHSVKDALPSLKKAIIEAVNGDIVSGGVLAKTIKTYAR